MIDSQGNPQNRIGIMRPGHIVRKAVIIPRPPDHVIINRHHPDAAVDAIDLLNIGTLLNTGDPKRQLPLVPRLPGIQVQPIGRGRVKKQLLRGDVEDQLRIIDVEGNVSPSGLFPQQHTGHCLRIGKSMGKDQSPPAHIDQ